MCWGGRASAVLLVLALLAVGCGQKQAPGLAQSGEPVVSQDSASAAPPVEGGSGTPGAPGEPGSSEARAEGTAEPGAASSAQPAPSGTLSGPPLAAGPRHNTGEVRITLSDDCVTRGSAVLVTVKAPPNSGIGAVVAYADKTAHDAMTAGEADAEGDFLWRFTVSVTAPFGPARVMVGATGANWEGENSSADALFKVVRRAEECS